MAAVGAAYAAASAAQVAAVASTAIAVASTVASQVQANANANAQEDAAKLRNEQLAEQTIANYDELADVERDAAERANEDAISVQKDYIKGKGRINVMAAAMGTAGQSVTGQLSALEREKYSNYNTILLSRQAEQDNIRSQAENMRYQAANSMQVSPVSRPSYAAAALNLGSVSLSGYSNYQDVSSNADLLKTTGSLKGST